MPKQVKAEYNTFVKGLISEASPLNFPDNASLDEQNFILSRKGTRARRKGIDIEPGGVTRVTGITLEGVLARNPSTYQWFSPGGVEGLVVLVIQVNNNLHFYDQSQAPLSDVGWIEFLSLSIPDDVSYSFASVDGVLIVASGDPNVAVITYDPDAVESKFSASYERLTTRDVWGVEVVGSEYETDVTFREAAVPPDSQKYNLQNQSWGIPRRRPGDPGTLQDPVFIYEEFIGKYPSNSEVVWTGLQYLPVSADSDPTERLYGNIFDEVIGGDILAPRGYYVIDVLDRGVSRMAQFEANKVKYPELLYTSVGLPEDSTPSGATIVADFAGRVFYGGFGGEIVDGDARSPSLSSYIFFSQLVKSKRDVFKCYQEGDPTSRENSDLVDTDGGFIRVSGMNKLIGMFTIGSYLIILADNGVWSVTGGSDYGFSPVNLKVSNISTFGGISGQSIIEVQGKGLYWGSDGIYVIDRNQFGDLVVNSLTDATIQTYFDNIPLTSKTRVSGAYDGYAKKAHWLWREGTPFDADTSITKELTFDFVLNAFSVNQIYPSKVGSTVEIETFCVIPPVLTSSSTEVIQFPIYLFVKSLGEGASYSFAYYHNEEFKDWGEYGTNGGADAYAYLITGDTTGGDSSVRKYLPYMTVHMYRTEEGVDSETLQPLKQSGCLARVRWDWSNQLVSNKWSREQQVYRYRKPRLVEGPFDDYETGFKLITTRNKIRGSGKAFSVVFSTEPLKDCQIVGWNIVGTVEDV